jgi:hypothetical protein
VAFNPSAPKDSNNPQVVVINNQINNFIGYVASAPGDPTTAYFSAGGYGTPTMLYRLTDISFRGNGTAMPITGGPVNGDVLGPVAVSNSGWLYLAKAGFLEHKLFKTYNGGNAWYDISGNLPNVPVHSVAVDPDDSNIIYVATNVGVYTASDGGSEGEQWQVLGRGLPNVPVMQLKITHTRKLVAATFGRGVWQLDLPFPPPESCQVTVGGCGNSATLICDPIHQILTLGSRQDHNVSPSPDFTPGGFTLPVEPFGASAVFNAPIGFGDNEFEACAVYRSPSRQTCIWPVPFIVDLTSCPGHAPPPPKPSQCIKEGCTPKPGGGCICQ